MKKSEKADNEIEKAFQKSAFEVPVNLKERQDKLVANRSENSPISIRKLLRLWADIWVAEQKFGKLAWIYGTGNPENHENELMAYASSKDNNTKDIVSADKPPKVRILAPSHRLKVTELPGTMEISNPRDIFDNGHQVFSAGPVKVKHGHEYSKNFEAHVEQTFEEGFEISANLEYFGAGIGAKYSLTEIFTKGHSNSESEKQTFECEMEPLSDKKLRWVIREFYSEYAFSGVFQIDGHIILGVKKAFKGKIKLYSVTDAINDLFRYSQKAEHSSLFTPAIRSMLSRMVYNKVTSCYEINITGKYRTNSISCKPELGENEVEKMMALRESLHNSYTDQFKEKSKISMAYYTDVVYDGEYLDLNLREIQKNSRKGTWNAETLEAIAPKQTQDRYRLLITGVPGVGKSTLGNQVIRLSATQASNWSTFEWVFLIPLRNLTEKNYPNDKGPYGIGDIILRESFLRGEIDITQLDSLKLLNDHWKELFRSIVTGVADPQWMEIFQSRNIKNRALIILDGFDELVLPESLKQAFREIFACPFVTVISRGFDLYLLESMYKFINPKRIEVLGFSKESSKQYATNYLKSFSDEDSSEAMFNYLHGRLDPEIRVPVILQMLCMSWIHHGPTMEKKVKELSMATLLEDIILTWCARYLPKFHPDLDEAKVRGLSPERIMDYCAIEVFFAEYFAFYLFNIDKSSGPHFEALNYLKLIVLKPDNTVDVDSTYLKIVTHANFGFVLSYIPSPFSGNAPGFADSYFNLEIFRDYFAARYLVSCIQTEMKCNSLLGKAHTWRKVDGLDLQQYLEKKLFVDAHEGVLKFMTQILEMLHDKTGLTYLRAAAEKKKTLPISMPELRSSMLEFGKHYRFNLIRKNSGLLSISGQYDQKAIPVRKAFREFNDLADSLIKDVEVNAEIKTCVIVKADDDDRLDIKSSNIEHLDAVAKAIVSGYNTEGDVNQLSSRPIDEKKEGEDSGSLGVVGCTFQ